MNENLSQVVKSKLIFAIFILSSLTVIGIPSALADGINLDGVVVESEWTLWFKDESQNPRFNVSSYLDSDKLYIAILTNDTNENDDLLQFAFQASEYDYWVEIKPGYWTKYRPSGGSWEGYWRGARDGLPTGVSAAYSKTEGKRSYELSIELSILGKRAIDFPEHFKVWFMVVDGNPDGSVNYYPDALAGWWWQTASIESGGENGSGEETPNFSIPELPVGTIMALISGFAALALLTLKRPLIKK